LRPTRLRIPLGPLSTSSRAAHGHPESERRRLPSLVDPAVPSLGLHEPRPQRLAHVMWDTEEGKRGQLTEHSGEGKPGSGRSRLQTAAPVQGSHCVRQRRRSQPRGGGSRWRVPDAAMWAVGRKWPAANVMRAPPRVVRRRLQWKGWTSNAATPLLIPAALVVVGLLRWRGGYQRVEK
jgi:hypothetical protein